MESPLIVQGNRFSLMRASAVVKCQSALTCFLLRLSSQAAISAIRVGLSGMRDETLTLGCMRVTGPARITHPARRDLDLHADQFGPDRRTCEQNCVGADIEGGCDLAVVG